jgi:hypothetical protein
MSILSKSQPRIGCRIYAILLVAVALMVLGAVGAANFVIDPLQRLRTAKFYPPQFETQQRLQAPALARSADYDSIVLGTSTAENVRTADANPILGGRFLRLPISGGSLREQRLVLDVALGTGKPKRVLWFLDGFTLTQPRDFVRVDFGPFPEFMYANGADAIARYLLNFETLQKSLGIAVGIARGDLPPPIDLDRLNAPADDTPYGRDRVMAAYRDTALRGSWAQVIDRRMSRNPAVAADAIATNIVSAVRASPGVRFDFVLVPPSIAQMAFWATHSPDFFEAVLSARREFVRQVADFENIRVHDFWGDASMVDDLDRYSDMIHYDLRTTREILAGVAVGKFSANFDSIIASELELRARIVAFRERNPVN